MKQLKKLRIPAILIAMLSIGLNSCDDDSQEIERFKNEYRDPNLFGKWKLYEETNDYYVEIFTKTGEWESETMHSNGGKYKQFNYYYYTDGNKLYYLFPGSNVKGGRDSGFCLYKIEKDTLVLTYKDIHSSENVSRYIRLKE